MELKSYAYSVIGKEVSTISKYFDRVIHFSPIHESTIANWVEAKKSVTIPKGEEFKIKDIEGTNILFLDGNINHSSDVQSLLGGLKNQMNRSSRIVAVLYNPYLRWVFQLLNRLGLREGDLPETFISESSLKVLAQLSGFEISRLQTVLFCPFRFFGLGALINNILRAIPGIRHLGFASVVTLRPLLVENKKPSLTIVVPARNEAGNISRVIPELKNLEDLSVEIIFVEGHSKDDTWEQIQQEMRAYQGPFTLKAYQQTGKGKKNAVLEGFEKASGDLLTILDADLTMPAEKIRLFYDTYTRGLGDFINGSRLVYPMADGSMQFLNHLGNIFFAKALSFVTDQSFTDSLCGTKLVSKKHYGFIREWCRDFGDFDPFGDFELIFPASVLGLGSIDIPIRYQARTYGETNISRFQHGWQLLRMTFIGLITIKMGRTLQRS